MYLMEDKEIFERLAKLEGKLESTASQNWVKEIIQPLQHSLIEMQHSVKELSDDLKMLLTEHSELLKSRAEQERQQHEEKLTHERRLYEEKLAALEAEKNAAKERTVVNIIKEKWAPVLGFIMTFAAFLSLIATLFVWWFTHYVLPLLPKG